MMPSGRVSPFMRDSPMIFRLNCTLFLLGPICRSRQFRYNCFLKRKARLAPGQFDEGLDNPIVSPLRAGLQTTGLMADTESWDDLAAQFEDIDRQGFLCLRWVGDADVGHYKFSLVWPSTTSFLMSLNSR